ncbi:MAG TPA: glycoside hydrolase domain-containing protein [Flavitalea sp.]|nr:glycoside hydrolase domain-containing protein [Flavitalea sp.]
MKRIVIACLYCFIPFLLSAQPFNGQINANAIPRPAIHYQTEYTFDVSTDATRWQREKPGMHISFAPTDQLYFRADVPNLKSESQSWETTAWRGERVNAMILVWSTDTVDQVRINIKDLKSDKGKSVGVSNIHINLIRYVVSNFPYNAVGLTCGSAGNDSAFLMPDRLEQFDRFELPGKTVRPIWLSIDIPAKTEAGSYTTTVNVQSDKQQSALQLKINVQNQVLPKPQDWKHRLDLWQNPWVVAWRNHLEPWSEDHMILLRKHMKLYADAGGKYITTYTVHSPWSDNSYMIEGTMIEWIQRANGSWKFDYKIFDQYVQMCIGLGIDEAITIYTPVPWGFRFRYMDEKTGNYKYESWAPDSKEFKDFWNVFLTDLKKHLEAKGWFSKTYLGINENEMEHTLAAIKVIKAHSKQWRITYAGNWHKELDGLLDDYSFLYGQEPTLEQQKSRAARGATSTYYVCCNPDKPNTFVFSPPVEGRWISWYTAAMGYDGFLRWAYDAWPADPERDARHELWPAGDCFMVYPGGNSSIRLEKLREGIVDFEKIQILKKLAAKSTNAAIKSQWQQLEQHLQTLTTEK